jgi:chemotaxis protein methyltransferase CheR
VEAPVRPDDFEFIAGLVKKRSGLVLSKDKVYLVESRLAPVARRHGLATVDDLARKIRLAPPESLLKEITEAMTTNESFFFRDKIPFDTFSEVILPNLMVARQNSKSLRIWCAASSTGQEPYSLAMIIKEKAAQLQGWRIEIVGTDISSEVIDRAKRGLYTQFEVQRGLPIQYLVKSFKKIDDHWEIDPSLKTMVQYKLFNLLDDYRGLGSFDCVYCRNVLIYFDAATKKDVLERASKQMASDSYLVLGAAETVIGVTDAFKLMDSRRGLYIRNAASASGHAAPLARAAGV